MPNGNPYEIKPGGDWGTGLQGLSQTLYQADAMRRQRQMLQQQQLKEDYVNSLFDAVNNPERIPEIAGNLKMRLGQAGAQPQQIQQIDRFMETYRQDPVTAIERLKNQVAYLDPQRFAAFQKASTVQEEELPTSAQEFKYYEKLLYKDPYAARAYGRKAGFIEDIETNLTKNLQSAGFQPGTPEFQDAMIKILLRPEQNVEVKVGESETEFNKRFGKINADLFFEQRAAAQDAATSLEGIDQARNLLKSGVITGLGANFLTGMGKALSQAGINFADDAIANTEAFTSAQAKQVATIIKAFGAGTGLSDADRDFAIKAAGGDIALTRKSIERILDINEKASKNVIKRFNLMADKIDPNLSPYPLKIPIRPISEMITYESKDLSEFQALPLDKKIDSFLKDIRQ